MPMSRFILLQIRSRLKAVADAKKGPQMQSYMKSKMPYIGVPAPILRKELREIFALKFKNASKEFFLRKAIGWALRQYAWTDPNEVQRYVREHAAQLSPLSTREALKNVSG